MKKLIVVTGGTKGIGKSIIKLFASKNFDVITCSRNKKDLGKLGREITTQYESVELYHRTADLSDRKEVASFIQFIKDIGKPIDVLVNNAGLFMPGQVHTEEEGSLEKMINTNLYSAYHLTRGLIMDMKERNSGHIFNMCSTASIMPYVNGGSYCISKFALLGMSKVLREEMKGHGVKVTSVLPGATLTASWEGAGLPESRFMKSDDVAEAVWSAYSLSKNAVVEDIVIRPQLGDI